MRRVALSEWIKEQNGRGDSIGDVAFDACRDSNWPQQGGLDELREHLPESLHPILDEAEDERREEEGK